MREDIMDMESKQPLRPSIDGPTGSPGSSASGASALRRLTRSPSHRLSLRRNSTSSSVSSSSSIVSAISDDNDGQQLSCVTRDTARDECGLHRFIVWAAIKRNECQKMTPEEKRECPLLRCRKRFPNHELMLQHLYTCEQLAVGEYWCYNCGKVERFSDAKCKRCLGHPSKRRKIVSMAKHFFSTLGHKSKSASMADLGLDMDESEAPPSYMSLLDPPHGQAELFSNEIHEIDSHEIQLPTIPEDVDEVEVEEIVDPLPEQAPDLTPLPVQPRTIPRAELESAPILTDSLINWSPLPETVVPANLFNNSDEDTSFDRPVLQLYTHGLEQYRAQAKKRSKALAPSSSVRSTASTSSTNSTNSTLSTFSTFSAASYNISPMSEWSGAWQKSHGFESTLTSPADDLVSPGGLLSTNPFANSCKASMADASGAFEKSNSDSFLSELPADDIPMLDAFPTSDTLHDTLGLDQSLFPFDASVPTELTLESNLAMTDNPTMPPEMPQLEADPVVGYYGNTHSLVGTAWEALEMHITDSMAKLQQVSKNHLVNQLGNMSPQSIARDGLQTLTDILEGRQPTAPVKLLCFVHLAYALSLVVFEQDATSRSKDLFGQALSYSTWFSRQDRQAYIHIVNALWKPAAMSHSDVLALIRAKASPAVSRSGSLKGKEREVMPTSDKATDSLVFVAQYFLDELEHAAVQANTDQPIIQTSDLYTQHLRDKSMDVNSGSPFVLTVIFMLTSLSQRYSAHPEFINSLKDLQHRVNSNSVSTTRRLDLELMQAGKMYLPSNVYFDDYIGYARTQVDQLYKNIPDLNQRNTYYRHGIKLIETMIGAPDQMTNPQPTPLELTPATTALDSLDEFIESLTPNMDGFDFGTVPSFSPSPQIQGPIPQPPLNFSGPMPDMTIDPCALNNTQLMPTPEGSSSLCGPSTAATSPPSPSPGSASRVESNSWCEICGYRPKGDPRWFGGSMAKHKKLQHASTPPKIYRCPFPGCTSQYKNRPDNLRQHQIEKGHFVEGQGESSRRPNKRKKTDV